MWERRLSRNPKLQLHHKLLESVMRNIQKPNQSNPISDNKARLDVDVKEKKTLVAMSYILTRKKK